MNIQNIPVSGQVLPAETQGVKERNKPQTEEKPAIETDKVEVGSSENRSPITKVKDWIKENITGKSKPEGDKKELGYSGGGDYGRFQHGTAMAIGASAGAGIGAIAGLIGGHTEVSKDSADIVQRNHSIRDPKLVGFSHWAHEVGHTEREYTGTDSQGHAQYRDRYVVDGYWHRYSPDIQYTQVGSYNTPEYQHTSGWTPITGALVGLAGGAVVGGLLGLVSSVTHKAVKKHIQGGNQ